jgi:hypothetical protein
LRPNKAKLRAAPPCLDHLSYHFVPCLPIGQASRRTESQEHLPPNKGNGPNRAPHRQLAHLTTHSSPPTGPPRCPPPHFLPSVGQTKWQAPRSSFPPHFPTYLLSVPSPPTAKVVSAATASSLLFTGTQCQLRSLPPSLLPQMRATLLSVAQVTGTGSTLQLF